MPLAPDPPFPKSQGNSIRSKDWNDAVNEVIRLDSAKLNRSGDAITGMLTVSGNLGVGTASPGAKLEIKGAAILDNGGNAQIFTGTGSSELNRYLDLLNSPGNASSSGLRVGGVLVSDTYTYATPGKNDLVVKGKLAVGTPTAGSTLHVNGGGTVGPFSPYAPLNRVGSLNVTGSTAELGFVRRNLAAWPSPVKPGDRFAWYNPDGVARLSTDGGGDLLTIRSNGSTGIGIGDPDPQLRLEVAGRVRLYPDANSAGLWLAGQTAGSSAVGDRAFIGLRDNNSVGFWGNVGDVGNAPGWKLWVDTSSGALSVIGPLIPTSGVLFVDGQLRISGSLNPTTGTLAVNGGLIIGGQASKPGGGAWQATSDVRLKQNIEPLRGALDRLLQLRGIVYEWKEPAKHGNLTGPQIGFIGQEVEKVFPQWVDETQDGYKAVAICGFEALAVEALRELRAENQQLMETCRQLQAELARLTASKTTGDVP